MFHKQNIGTIEKKKIYITLIKNKYLFNQSHIKMICRYTKTLSCTVSLLTDTISTSDNKLKHYFYIL